MRVIPFESAWSPYPEGKVEKKIEPAPVAKLPDPYDSPYKPQPQRYSAGYSAAKERERFLGYYGGYYDPKF